MKNSKMVLSIIFAIIIFLIAQTLASVFSNAFLIINAPDFICNVFEGIIYAVLGFCMIKFLCNQYLKEDMKNYYIPKFNIKWKWIIIALILPLLVSASYMFFPGSFEKNAFDLSQKLTILTSGIFVIGFASGIVEEMVFRGIIMSVIEKRFSRTVAIIAPSLLFGLFHIINRRFDFVSYVLVIFAGTMVGVMFSLITIESKSVWNSAIVHAFWNIIIIGGILNIGTTFDEKSLYSYILDTRLFVWTGGEFGIEASAISVVGYCLVSIVAIIFMKKSDINNK